MSFNMGHYSYRPMFFIDVTQNQLVTLNIQDSQCEPLKTPSLSWLITFYLILYKLIRLQLEAPGV